MGTDLGSLPVEGTEDRRIVEKTVDTIVLDQPLDESIDLEFGLSQARLHMKDMIYMYPALAGDVIPGGQFQLYNSGDINGEEWGIHNDKFRPGTKYIKLGFRANYMQQNEDATMLVRNFRFSVFNVLLY